MDPGSVTPYGIKQYLAALALSFSFVFGAVWIWVAAAPMAYLSWDYPVWLMKARAVEKGLTGKVVIMGDSTPNAALIPHRLGADVVNLGLTGASPVEVYFQSKRILVGSSRPLAVILSLTPQRFMMQDVFWEKSANFGSFTYAEVDEVRALTRSMNETGPFGTRSPFDLDMRLKAALYTIKFPSLYAGALLNARFFERYQDNVKVYQAVQASRGQIFFGEDAGFRKVDEAQDFPSFSPLKVLDEYFHRTLELYRSRNIPVYFIAVPHNEVSVPHYPFGWKEDFEKYVRGYENREPNFHVLGDLLSVYPYQDFGDADHLNESGAIQWSDTVAKMLNDANVPGGPFGPN